MKYSVLASGIYAKNLDLQKIQCWLEEGIKINLFFSSQEEASRFEGKNYDYYNIYVGNVSAPNLYMEDGHLLKGTNENFKSLENLFPSFNYGQYVVEHSDTEATIIVKASAGTGKTKVMLDRILFLLATVDGIKPSDICMITFTRAAALSMLSKLQDRLMDMFMATRKKKYLEFMEEISEMNISTIDSFFYNLVKLQGSALGFGKDIKITSHIYEKQRFIDSAINDMFEKGKHTDFTKSYILPIHEYRDLVMGCWDKLNGRGYYGSSIASMNFGKGQNPNSEIINNNIREILVTAEQKYSEYTKAKNAFSISDISRCMVALTETVPKKMNVSYRFVFIDEFQDTDDGQIRCIAWLKKYLHCQLFVVGDVKQSIYRFRGAEEKAFDSLIKEINNHKLGKVFEAVLSINYRTRNSILQALNPIFQKFGRKGYLEWDKDVYSFKEGESDIEFISYERASGAVPELVNYLEDHRDKDTCVLVRSNYYVKRISEECRKMGIPCVAVQEGNFYRSEPVLDMVNLLGSLVYPSDNHRLFNYLLSPYCKIKPNPEELSVYSGDEELVREYLTETAEKNNWSDYVSKVKNTPIFQLIREIVRQSDCLNNYQTYKYAQIKHVKLHKNATSRDQLKRMVDLEVKFYNMNLNKLMSILGDHFSNSFVSLLTVYEFLVNKMQTDHDEDALYPDLDEANEDIIKVMTVHKSKGLEFHKVIVFCSNSPFIQDYEQLKLAKEDANSDNYQRGRERLDFIAVEDSSTKSSRFGWFYTKNNNWYANDIHKSIREEEDAHTINEEIRLLYVALTRAKDKLLLVTPTKNKLQNYTWAYYYNEK